MKSFRCKFCHKLLFCWDTPRQIDETLENYEVKGNYNTPIIEIKCPKCGKINILTRQQIDKEFEDRRKEIKASLES